jgi:Tyrosine phosphatase family
LLPESASRERAHMALGATDTGRSDKPQAERPKKRGLRARWPGPGSWPLEKEACESLQLDLYEVAIRARQVPRKQDLLDLIDLLSSLSYPALIHCKSGADRAGFVAAVYLIAVEGRSASACFAVRADVPVAHDKALKPSARNYWSGGKEEASRL